MQKEGALIFEDIVIGRAHDNIYKPFFLKKSNMSGTLLYQPKINTNPRLHEKHS